MGRRVGGAKGAAGLDLGLVGGDGGGQRPRTEGLTSVFHLFAELDVLPDAQVLALLRLVGRISRRGSGPARLQNGGFWGAAQLVPDWKCLHGWLRRKMGSGAAKEGGGSRRRRRKRGGGGREERFETARTDGEAANCPLASLFPPGRRSVSSINRRWDPPAIRLAAELLLPLRKAAAARANSSLDGGAREIWEAGGGV